MKVLLQKRSAAKQDIKISKTQVLNTNWLALQSLSKTAGDVVSNVIRVYHLFVVVTYGGPSSGP